MSILGINRLRRRGHLPTMITAAALPAFALARLAKHIVSPALILPTVVTWFHLATTERFIHSAESPFSADISKDYL